MTGTRKAKAGKAEAAVNDARRDASADARRAAVEVIRQRAKAFQDAAAVLREDIKLAREVLEEYDAAAKRLGTFLQRDGAEFTKWFRKFMACPEIPPKDRAEARRKLQRMGLGPLLGGAREG